MKNVSLLALVLALGCGGGTEPNKPLVAFSVVSGDNQTGVVGTQLPAAIVVRVEDAAGRPVPNQPVSFIPVTGGTMFAGFSITDANGEVRDYWTLGTAAGPQRLEGRAVDPTTGEQQVFDVVRATAVAEPPTSVTMQNVTLTVAPGAQVDLRQYVQSVEDRYGNIVTDYVGESALTVYSTEIGANPPPTEWSTGTVVAVPSPAAPEYLAWMRVGSGYHFIHIKAAP